MSVPVRRSLCGWRSWLAAYVLLAIAWPAAGPLPWVAFEHGAAHHAARHDAGHEHRHAAATESDDSDVPGSPTHPLDHDCAQCQVLKHLARCVLSDPVDVTVPPPYGCPVHAPVASGDIRAGVSVPRPPIRGPPVFPA